MLRFTCWVNAATAATARPARRPAALQLVGIESLFRLVVPCWTPRGTHPDDRPTAPSRFMVVSFALCRCGAFSGLIPLPAYGRGLGGGAPILTIRPLARIAHTVGAPPDTVAKV